jgi:tRNA(His) 5'-end guanylyltransferase
MELPHWHCRAMAVQDHKTDTVAQIIAQCRRDIAAAWTHIDAAKEVMNRSRSVYERRKEQLAVPVTVASEPLRLRSQGFVMIPENKIAKNRRRRSRRQ